MNFSSTIKRTIKLILALSVFILLSVFIVLGFFPKLVAEGLSREVQYKPEKVPGIEMACYTQAEPVEWSYCVNQPSQNMQSNKIVYHFHGRRGNATWWNDDSYYSGEVYRRWKQSGVTPPIVVSISFGPLWLLKEGDLLDVVVDKIVPHVEQQLGINNARRLVVGESMGGVNALMVWLKTENLFDKAASLCPPIPTISPTAPLSEMLSYVNNSETSWRRGLMMYAMGRYFFEDETSWQQNSPLAVADSKNFKGAGELYLSCGKRDEWGCMSGSRQLVEKIKSQDGQVEWVPGEGGHCDIDVESLADFLIAP